MMMMMMMMLCKSRAQVRDLCVEINNFKLPVMQKTPIFTTFSARRKMAAEKRGQIKVFGRNYSTCSCTSGIPNISNQRKQYKFVIGVIHGLCCFDLWPFTHKA